MKRKKLKMLLAIFTLSSLFAITPVMAASFSYCQITGIPGGGGSAVDFSHPNTKASTAQGSRFKADYISAALGLKAQMVNSNAVDKSYSVPLVLNKTVYAAGRNNPLPGYNYYAKGITQGMEWSSGQVWRGNFSADPR